MDAKPKKKHHFFNQGRGTEYSQDINSSSNSSPFRPLQEVPGYSDNTHTEDRDGFIDSSTWRYRNVPADTGGYEEYSYNDHYADTNPYSASLNRGYDPQDHLDYYHPDPYNRPPSNSSQTTYYPRSEYSNEGDTDDCYGYTTNTEDELTILPDEPINSYRDSFQERTDEGLGLGMRRQDTLTVGLERGDEGTDDDGQKSGKRVQTCRLCANHGQTVKMKGHKLFCPFIKDHDCEKCDITKQRRKFVALQQRQTRNQQAALEGGYISPDSASYSLSNMPPGATSFPPPRRPSSSASHPEFPQLGELIKETNDIIDPNLFDKINKLLEPPSHIK